MNLQRKAAILVFGITAVTCAVSAYFSYGSHRQLVEGAKQRQLSLLATFIQNDMQDLSNKAAARASLICSLPSIQEAFRAGDRDQLARRLVPAFLIQRDKYGVREGQFHLPPATSFLRVFDLKAPQEDLSGFREMVLATNRKQTPQKGVEIGRRGLSIRGIDLIKDDKGPIGSFEIGMSFTTLLTDIKGTTGFEAGVFVDDKLMSSIATEISRPAPDRIVGDFQCVDATNWEMVRRVASPDALAKVNDVVLTTQTVGGVDYGIVLAPLLDFKGKQIGSIAAVGDFSAYQVQLKAALVEIVYSSILEGIVFAGGVLILINTLFSRPLREIDRALERLAKGELLVDGMTLPQGEDELGSIARNIEKARTAITGQKLSASTSQEAIRG
jgi:methyl-accepting chemotaxis protein